LNSESFRSKFFISGDRVEKALSLGLLVLFLSSIVVLGYWALDRTYNRFFVLVMNPLILFVATLVLRLKLMDVESRASDLAKSSYEDLGLAIEDAVKLFKYRDELKVVKNWVTLVTVMTILSLLIGLIFPV